MRSIGLVITLGLALAGCREQPVAGDPAARVRFVEHERVDDCR